MNERNQLNARKRKKRKGGRSRECLESLPFLPTAKECSNASLFFSIISRVRRTFLLFVGERASDIKLQFTVLNFKFHVFVFLSFPFLWRLQLVLIFIILPEVDTIDRFIYSSLLSVRLDGLD